MDMWGLDEDDDGEMDRGRSAGFKPQRECCGNNVSKSPVPRFLDTRPGPEREAWVAMEWTESP